MHGRTSGEKVGGFCSLWSGLGWTGLIGGRGGAYSVGNQCVEFGVDVLEG